MHAALGLVLLLAACRPAAVPATPSKNGPIVAATIDPTSDPTRLLASTDERTLLSTIQAYLRPRGMPASLETDGVGLTLVVPYANGDDAWSYRVRVFDGGGGERALAVQVHGDFFIEPARDEDRVLFVLNQHHRIELGGVFALDTDGEVVGARQLDLPASGGLPVAFVHDAIVRLGKAWSGLRTLLTLNSVRNLRA
jgi:hypothetical protein